MKLVADNSGSGATMSTRIEESARNPQIIPGQKSASRKLNLAEPGTRVPFWGRVFSTIPGGWEVHWKLTLWQ